MMNFQILGGRELEMDDVEGKKSKERRAGS